MDIVKRAEIEEKLRKLIEDELKKDDARKISAPKVPCNVIRRRKGEKDKRIYVLN